MFRRLVDWFFARPTLIGRQLPISPLGGNAELLSDAHVPISANPVSIRQRSLVRLIGTQRHRVSISSPILGSAQVLVLTRSTAFLHHYRVLARSYFFDLARGASHTKSAASLVSPV